MAISFYFKYQGLKPIYDIQEKKVKNYLPVKKGLFLISSLIVVAGPCPG